MGAVYRARHAETGVSYALKVILADVVTGPRAAIAMARFRREAEVLARIDDHPAVVRIHATGVDAGKPWCAMELVPGRSLGDEIEKHGPPPPETAARILAAACRGIAHAHAHGIYHRDLKPENILIDVHGQPRVVDFGLAYDVFADELTKTGELLGTPAFMAPEQLGSGESRVGPGTDVYGAGATLYAALAGQPPFGKKGPVAVMSDILLRMPEPPSTVVPAVPRALDAVCLKALAKDAADRYAGPAELADDLERWLRGEDVDASPPPSGIARLAARYRPRTRGGFFAGALALVAALALLGAIVTASLVLWRGEEPGKRLARLERRLEHEGALGGTERDALERLAERAEVRDDADLARRAELAVILTAIGAGDVDGSTGETGAALRIAALVRPDGAVDPRLLARATKTLDRASRPVALHHVLHGAEPIAIAPIEVAGSIARALAAPGATIHPPRDGPAFKALLRTLGDDEAAKGRLRVRRAEAALLAGERTDDALVELAAGFATSGLLPTLAPNDAAAFRRFCIERFAAWVRERTPEETAGLADVIVRLPEGTPDDASDALDPLDLTALLQEAADIRSIASEGSRNPSSEGARRQWLAAPVLVATFSMPMDGGELATLRRALGEGWILERAKAERRRPEAVRNPARLLFAADALIDLDPADRLDLVEAAFDSVEQPPRWLHVVGAWLLAHLARHEGHFDRGLAVRAIERGERALEADRAVAPRHRLPALPERLASLHAHLAGETGRRGVRVPRVDEASWRVIQEAALVEEASSRVEEYGTRGLRASALRWRGQPLARTLVGWARTRAAETETCCDPPVSPDELIDLAARLLENATYGAGNDLVGRDEALTAADLIAVRALHASLHGRFDEARAQLDEAIVLARRDAASSKHPADRRRLVGLLRGRAQVLTALGLAAESAADLDEARRLAPGRD